MKTFKITLDNTTKKRLILKLYKDVKNISTMRQDIMSGKLQCCIIKPTFIFDPMQVVSAANKAAVAQNQESLITRTVYSEILFNLSPTRNVTKSLTTFGADDNHTTILVAVIQDISEENENEDIFACVNGVECDIEELKSFVDINLVKKTYGLNDTNNERLLNAIINKIVTKEC